jgi:hypothetical protein
MALEVVGAGRAKIRGQLPGSIAETRQQESDITLPQMNWRKYTMFPFPRL